jgi:hypothetical protein
MDEHCTLLQSAAAQALDSLWNDFAKEGKESAVLAPLAQYPHAAAWLARSMAMNTDWRSRKLGAMLTGWIQTPQHVGLLSEMLDRQRKVFREDPMTANSIGEDIMFAATRWTESQHAQVRDAGIQVLAGMVKDALEGTHWNTANWAVANLHHATDGKHEIFQDLANATDTQLAGQKYLQNVVLALKQNNRTALNRTRAAPSELHSLPLNNPNYSVVSSLWKAAATAEATLQ